MHVPLRVQTSEQIFRASFLVFLCLLGSLPAWPLPGQVLQQLGRSISGSVKLKGRATTEQRIEVQLLTNDRRPAQRVFADTLGNFQFTGLPAGLYVIVIEELGYQRLEDSVEIPPRSLGTIRRYYTLEPITDSSGPVDMSLVSAQKFLVTKEAREFFEKGERELSKRHFESAAEFFDRVLSIAPNFADALNARALIYLQENNLAQAQEFFERAITSNPRLGGAYIGLGSVFVRQGNSEGSIEPLTKGLGLSPNSYLGHFERCRAYVNLGRFESAGSDCSRARELAQHPRPELLILLGNLYLHTGRQPEALREYEAYLRFDASSSTATEVRSAVKTLRDAGVKPAQ